MRNACNNDKAVVTDEMFVNGHRYGAPHQSPIVGEVEVILGSETNGKPIFTKTLHRNDLLVNGSVFFSEKINNMRSSFKTTPIDVEVGTHNIDEVIRDQTTIGNELICGMIIGNEGASYNAVRAVKRGARVVPGMIPFRVVPLTEDLSTTDRPYYFMRVVRGDYAYYYGKTFDVDREIYVMYEDGTVVPTNVENSSVSKFIKTFTRYKLTLDNRDVREYFKLTQGSTMKSLVNSVGLVAGYPIVNTETGITEYANVRCLTTMNMEDRELKDTESTITFIYRLYIL